MVGASVTTLLAAGLLGSAPSIHQLRPVGILAAVKGT